MICLSCSSAWAVDPDSIWTNEIIDFYNKPFDFYFSSKGHLCFKQPKIILAKIALVNWFFLPSYENCLFEDTLKKLEFDLAEKDEKILFWQRKYRLLKTRNIFIFAGAIGGGVIIGILTGKVFIAMRQT